MAVNMSKEDQDALAAAGDAWNKANAAGDKAGMDAAHAQAEAIRNNYGYSGGSDGSQYISKPSQDLPRDDPNHWSNQSSGGGSSGGTVSGNFNGNKYEYGPMGAGSDFYANNAGMSQADLDALSYAGKLWNEAAASGNRLDMDRAHQMAEQIRSKYGYSGGGDGSQYLPYQTQSTLSGGGWSYPSYSGQYDEAIDGLLGSILNRPAFSYDYTKDPLYLQYKEVYEREGDRAMRDTMGAAAAMTGGLASSYAVSAANQANNYYMAQLGDKIPELQQLAYSMWLDDYNMDMQNMSLLMGLDDAAYSRWYNDRNFNYGVYRDDISDNRYEDETAFNRWWEMYQYGNSNSIYQDETAYERALLKAETLAQFGNFSGYKDLGYTDAEIALMEQAYRQQMAAANATAPSRGSSGVSDGGGESESQTEAADEGYSEKDLDMASVLNLGIGPISYEMVEKLMEQGKIVDNGFTSGGKLMVKWADGYSAQKYKSETDPNNFGGFQVKNPFL